MDQQHYVGLDVSLETTSVCVINQSGAIVWRGQCRTEPEAISQAVRMPRPPYASALRRGKCPTG
jgi:transposase